MPLPSLKSWVPVHETRRDLIREVASRAVSGTGFAVYTGVPLPTTRLSAHVVQFPEGRFHSPALWNAPRGPVCKRYKDKADPISQNTSGNHLCVADLHPTCVQQPVEEERNRCVHLDLIPRQGKSVCAVLRVSVVLLAP